MDGSKEISPTVSLVPNSASVVEMLDVGALTTRESSVKHKRDLRRAPGLDLDILPGQAVSQPMDGDPVGPGLEVRDPPRAIGVGCGPTDWPRARAIHGDLRGYQGPTHTVDHPSFDPAPRLPLPHRREHCRQRGPSNPLWARMHERFPRGMAALLLIRDDEDQVVGPHLPRVVLDDGARLLRRDR